MAVIEELIRQEDNGTISFGNHLMDEKKKVLDFEVMTYIKSKPLRKSQSWKRTVKCCWKQFPAQPYIISP